MGQRQQERPSTSNHITGLWRLGLVLLLGKQNARRFSVSESITHRTIRIRNRCWINNVDMGSKDLTPQSTKVPLEVTFV